MLRPIPRARRSGTLRQASQNEWFADATRALKETQKELGEKVKQLEAVLKEAQDGKANSKLEIERIVQMHNKKYSEMLAQQLATLLCHSSSRMQSLHSHDIPPLQYEPKS